ncbi:MAG TPA: hypothetical protein GX707_12815, partial [Epulopiscium sp.]|nr:hypothetical protein [Candidatus Epulonipiscium sp.]
MAMPKSVVKISRDGVTYTSNVDRVQHTLRELQFRANYDVARFLMYRMRGEISKSKSMRNLPKNRKTNIFQYWVRKRDNDLQVGI